MRTKRILSPLGAIVFTLALFLGACTTADKQVAALTITTASLPGATTGASYSQNLAVTGGTPPYAWSFAAGSVIPPGIALSAGGVVSGMPTAAGDFTLAVQVHDNGGLSASRQLPLAIVANVQVATTFFPGQVANHAFSVQLDATGGTPPYSWSLASGALPSGVTLSAAGVLAGTVSSVGVSFITVRATDAASRSATQDLQLNVIPSAISITSGPVPDGETNVAYSSAITAIGGAPPYNWTVASGALPAGLTITSGGVIAGTPSASGVSTFTLHVADGASNAQNAIFTLTVRAAVSVATTVLSAGQKGTAYNALLGASGGVAPYDWTLVGGALPAGLTLAGSGSISGTPTATGASTFTLKLTDHLGGFASQNYSLTIAGPQVIITTPSLPDVEVGQPINRTMAASGTPPYTWSISSGTLPTGVTMNSAGVISGAATAAGPVTVGFQVTDAASSTYFKSYFFMVQPPVAITTMSVPAGQVSSSYFQTLAATGGIGAYTWNVYGAPLPPGITLSTGGVLSGTPTSTGTWDFFVRALDGVGGFGTRALTIVVNTQGLTITTATLPDCEAEFVYDHQLAASGGSQPYRWSLESGALFAGWTMSTAGVIHGTCGGSGSATFTVGVTDNAGAMQTKAYTITLHPDVQITTASLPDPTLGVAYSQTLLGQGGVTPYSWATFSACLPQGLSLNSATGVVSGTPTLLGPTICQINLTDALGVTDHKTYTLTVNP